MPWLDAKLRVEGSARVASHVGITPRSDAMRNELGTLDGADSLRLTPRACDERRMQRSWAAPIFVAVLALLASCGSDDRPATWSYIHEAVIQPNCTTSACHSDISAAAGVKLQDREGAYFLLTGRVCGAPDDPAQPPRNFVIPGNPSASKLMFLLRGQEVRNMPPDIPLPDVDIELIEQWILDGAVCD